MPISEKKINAKLFVVGTAAVFVFFVFLYFFFFQPSIFFRPTADLTALADQFFFRPSAPVSDPFITRQPSLTDALDGPIIRSADPHQGDLSAPVKVVIYSDYVCSFCREQEIAIRSLLPLYGQQVVFIRKDYPEPDVNSLSWQTAIAARCAGEQGKYWEYHDYLLSRLSQPASKNLDLQAAAAALGLAENDFSACVRSQQVVLAVQDNMQEAEILGISGVPFVYINNLALLGSVNEAELSAAIDKFLSGQQNSQP